MPPPFLHRVLVAGAGYVGERAAELLARESHQVWGLRRNPGHLPPGVRPLAVDLTAPGLEEALPSGLDRVLFTASSDGGGEEAYRRIYLEGLDALLEVLEAREPGRRARGEPPCRVLFTSSTAVYGDTGGEAVDETSPTHPESYRGEIMLQAEARILASPLQGTILRLGGIYGPGRTRLVDSVREGRATLPAEEPIWTNRIHRDDAAGALVHLVELPDPAPLYLGVDREAAPLHEVVRWLARAQGVAPPERDSEADRRRGNKRCVSHRLQASGYRFRYPTYREGYATLPGVDAARGGRGRG